MSDNNVNPFYAYREVLRRIDEETAVCCHTPADLAPAAEMQNGMEEIISVIAKVEKSLKNVISVKNSYNEIIKMIM